MKVLKGGRSKEDEKALVELAKIRLKEEEEKTKQSKEETKRLALVT